MIHEKKKSIIENDVVLVYIQDQPAFFARIEKIIADIKPGWWQVTFLVLQIPLITATWILDNEQIRGADFTMQGIPVRIDKVIAPTSPATHASTSEDEIPQQGQKATILSFDTRKKD